MVVVAREPVDLARALGKQSKPASADVNPKRKCEFVEPSPLRSAREARPDTWDAAVLRDANVAWDVTVAS